MATGAPQGSILGPLLYTIYVSPIGRLIASHGVEYHQYADDIVVVVSSKAINYLHLHWMTVGMSGADND